MTFIIGLLSFVLVLVCVALIFLVLIQLPKKDAGVGVAFGGGATDALFGAGSGNVLTKATKYAAVTFFVLAILVGAMQSRANKQRTAGFATAVTKAVESAVPESQPATSTPPITSPATEPAPLMSQPATAPAETPAAPAEAPAQN